jgi:2-polyprenyl-6-methoxyphenol hydroxylase-like FAD-dependent oxidoreductase
MNTSTSDDAVLDAAHKTRFDHAVVIGSSISGLLAARVLSDYFDRVTMIDRDGPPDPLEFRRGAPQTRHAHRLLPHGQTILEQLFPGLVDELQAQGAVPVDNSQEITIDYQGHWHTARPRPNPVSLSCSRVLLDSTIYQRLAALPNVHILQGYEVIGLQVDDLHERVTGIRLQCRRCRSGEIELAADLVIDTSGRNSKAPQWLESLGYMPPEEWSVDSFVGYATRIYERPADFDESWKILYVAPTPPDGTRGGVIIPIEGDRWHVTLLGVAEDYPPVEDDAFLEFARSLSTPQLYEAIQDAKPLTRPVGFQRTASRLRRYDKLPRYLEGFLVCGDAAYILNPLYAQGMTAAAIGSQALDQCLARHTQDNLTGLSHAFQEQLSRSLSHLWHMVTTQAWHWSATTVTDNRDEIYLNHTDSMNPVPGRN